MARVLTLHEHAGAFTSRSPWDGLELSTDAAELLRRPGAGTLPVTELTWALPGTDIAVQAAVHTGRPQVITRPARIAGADRIITTIATCTDRGTEDQLVRGWMVDVSEELGTPAGTELDGIAVVVRGPVAAVVAAGEFDIARRDEFAAALRAVEDADRDVHLDTRHVRFLEGHAAVMLDELAAALAPRHRLVLMDPPRAVRLVLSVRRSDSDDALTAVPPLP